MSLIHQKFSIDYILAKIVIFFSFLISFLPYRLIQKLGCLLGLLFFYFMPKFRKRIYSNLSLANIGNENELELKKIAKQSLQSLAISLLEFPKLKKEKELSGIVSCLNPELADNFIQEGKGVIFLCAHQANWELFFLEGNSRMKGIAVGRPIKNRYLYDYILSVRQRFGGNIIQPKSLIKEGLKALKLGKFIGIVGDQGMPESNFSSLFLGVPCFSTTAPSLLAYKTNSPIIVATMKRDARKYQITYSQPLIPDTSNDMKSEIERLTKLSLQVLEKSIIETPHEWLWLHNRFKQEPADKVFYRYRQDCLLIIVESMNSIRIDLLRILYPKAFLYFYTLNPSDATSDTVSFCNLNLPIPKDYKYKMILNMTCLSIFEKHFKKLACIVYLNINDLDYLINKQNRECLKLHDEKIIMAVARNPKEILTSYAT